MGPVRVERTRLLALLEESTAPVVVLSAPAGSGKSTLAQQWVAADGRASATVRLASHLDDPALVAAALQDSLSSLGAGAPGVTAVLTATEPRFSAAVLPGLTALAGACPAPYLLVIDDVHLLRSPSAVRVLGALCDGVPRGSCVVLLTRHQTPAWLARQRAEGRLLELAPYDIAFDLDESGLLLRALGHDLDPGQVAEITAHTEGWAVGLYLTGLALGAGTTASATRAVPLAHGSRQALADYLHTEVLAPLPPEHRDLLMRTSVLDALSGPLCDAVLERHDSAHLLAELQRSLQLLVPIDDEAHWLRVHHLLKDVLRHDLATDEPDTIPGLHRRAAVWFQQRGDVDEAVRHAAESGDLPLVSDLMWPHVIHSVASGRIGRLHGWLGYLSEAQRADDRWLSLASAWLALQEGDPTAAERWSRICPAPCRSGLGDAHDPRFLRGIPRSPPRAGGRRWAGAGPRRMCEFALRGLAPDDGFRGPAAFLLGVVLSLQGDARGGLGEPGRGRADRPDPRCSRDRGGREVVAGPPGLARRGS